MLCCNPFDYGYKFRAAHKPVETRERLRLGVLMRRLQQKSTLVKKNK